MGHAAAAAAAAGVGAAGSSDGACRTAGAAELQGQIGSDSDVPLQHTASQQVDALLHQRELENLAAAQQEVRGFDHGSPQHSVCYTVTVSYPCVLHIHTDAEPHVHHSQSYDIQYNLHAGKNI
jgi:hypothetical protein